VKCKYFAKKVLSFSWKRSSKTKWTSHLCKYFSMILKLNWVLRVFYTKLYMNPIIAFTKHKFSVELIIIRSCCLIGITFGGILITKSGKCVVNRKLKLFGNIILFLILTFYPISMNFTFNRNDSSYIQYESGFKIIYSIYHLYGFKWITFT
jgi:hypothetical protein